MRAINLVAGALMLLLLTACQANHTAAVIQPTLTGDDSITPAMQEGDWWMDRHKEKLALKEEMKQVDLVFLGDSITHWWDVTGKNDWQAFYGDRRALNIGFSGDKTENVLWRLQHGAVDNIDPKLLVMMLGTNNAGHRREAPELTARGIKAVLNELEVRLPNTKILMLAIFPRGETDADIYRQLTMATNDIIKGYADNDRVYWLNINEHFLDGNRVLKKSVMKDLLHPNPDQYKVWGEAIEAEVSKLMEG
ncbi:GDSL-type esterase/lipase family protein [Microbulbifer sp. 2304DJ12-6]|uniref:GDSL-type esterase/lipase family protein n=1 Tax=Microbulbifer sp. 2304DJ12-6 TaxID=3233340 RepID=UPI0039AFF774